DEAQARFNAGDAPVTDSDEAQARFDLIAAEEISADSELQQARSAFVAVTGIPADDLLPVSAQQTAGIETLDEWQARAQTQNPLIAMRRAGVDIAQAEVDKFQLLTSPKLDLVAQVGEERL